MKAKNFFLGVFLMIIGSVAFYLGATGTWGDFANLLGVVIGLSLIGVGIAILTKELILNEIKEFLKKD